MSYGYSEYLWQYVLPDGNPFCHWGGKNISREVLDHLELKTGDRLCDICCGEGGTLSLINRNDIEVYGIDISKTAIEKARVEFENKDSFHFVQSDVRNMPFHDCLFNKVFAQDPDVFLYPDKMDIMREISRVMRSKGIFVLQTYCASSYLGKTEREITAEILYRMGYPYTEVLFDEQIDLILKMSGFVVKCSKSMHSVYHQDNLAMIRNLEINWARMLEANEVQANNMRKLLYWEKYLFSKKAWTGILRIVKKR